LFTRIIIQQLFQSHTICTLNFSQGVVNTRFEDKFTFTKKVTPLNFLHEQKKHHLIGVQILIYFWSSLALTELLTQNTKQGELIQVIENSTHKQLIN
jgi:hypothetical protein